MLPGLEIIDAAQSPLNERDVGEVARIESWPELDLAIPEADFFAVGSATPRQPRPTKRSSKKEIIQEARGLANPRPAPQADTAANPCDRLVRPTTVA